MRIDSKSSIGRVAKSAKGRSPKRSGGNFQTQISGVDSVVATSGPIAGTEPVQGIDALLSVQQVAESSQERDWVRHWGDDILFRLSQLRDGLLSGNIPLERLERLSEALDSRQEIRDPELAQIVAEIELRGRIEIAKLQRDRLHRRD